MGDVVNLKRIRKRTAQEQAVKQAEINRVKFGRPKSERDLVQKETRQADDRLDQHRLARDDA